MRLIWIGECTRPRVLVAAPRRNELPWGARDNASANFRTAAGKEKVRDGEVAIASTRAACAPRINCCAVFL
jgi:hypothetical protein